MKINSTKVKNGLYKFKIIKLKYLKYIINIYKSLKINIYKVKII